MGYTAGLTGLSQDASAMKDCGLLEDRQLWAPAQIWETAKPKGDISQPVGGSVTPSSAKIWGELCGLDKHGPLRRREDFIVGLICALPKEQATTEAMPDERHPNLPIMYGLGGVGKTELTIQYAFKSQHMGRRLVSSPDRIAGVMASLRVSCSESMVKDPISGSKFVPLSAVRNLCRSETALAAVEAIIPTNFQDRQGIIENILGNDRKLGAFSKIFSILALMGKAAVISEFLDEGLHDDILPLGFEQNNLGDIEAFSQNRPGMTYKLFRYWPNCQVQEFERVQWSLIAPVLNTATGFSGGNLLYHPCNYGVLPFTIATRVQSGGTATVYKVSIHKDHNEVQRQDVSHYYAVKKIHASNTDDFKRELTALSIFNKSPHDHLIKLLATFQSKQNHYLLFPYAQGDLSRFWRLNPVAASTVKTHLWLVEQCLGITSALSKIHNVVEGGLDGLPLAVNEQYQTRFCGVHMDIKPQNILLFQSHQYEPNTLEEATVGARWVLADFGLSQIELSAGVLKAPVSRAGYTRTYRAPECDISSDQVSPAYDIWSLGCVFTEVATWIVTGSAGLRNFVDARAEGGDETACYSFFKTRIDNITGIAVSSVKPSVYDWMSNLRNHERCPGFICDLLDLVRKQMLVVKAGKRSSAKEISAILAKMAERIRYEPEYSQPCNGTLAKSSHRIITHNPGNTGAMGVRGFQTVSHNDTDLVTRAKRNPATDRFGEEFLNDEQQSGNSLRELSHWEEGLSKVEHRFACPFFKKDPQGLARTRACHGPGWKEIHRVKEHINRCHAPAKHTCSRCLEPFKTEELLFKHQRSDVQCPVREVDSMDGMVNPDQALSLKSRKRHASDMTDKEKWYEVYHILFPLDQEQSYPSPYYDSESTVSSMTSITTVGSSDLTQYKEYLNWSRTGEKQKALEIELGNALGISNPEMCKVLAEKFRDHQLRELQQFDTARLTYSIPDREMELFLNDDRADLMEPLAQDSTYYAIDQGPWSVPKENGEAAWDVLELSHNKSQAPLLFEGSYVQ